MKRWGRPSLSEIRFTNHQLSCRLMACMHILNLGIRMGITQEEADAVFAQGRALAERFGDQQVLARLLTNYGMVQGAGGAPHRGDRRTQPRTLRASAPR